MKIITLTLLLFAATVTLKAQLGGAILKSPEKVMPNIKKIAVLDFEGDNGKQAADLLITQFMDNTRGTRYYYSDALGLYDGWRQSKIYQQGTSSAIHSIVERSELEKVLSEQRLSSSKLITDAEATKAGKILGVDAILSGTSKKNEYSSSQDGCSLRQVKIILTLKILDPNTGQVLGITTVEKISENKECKGGAQMAFTDLADAAMKNATKALADYISPYYVYYNTNLKKIKVKEEKDKAKKAQDLLENGDAHGAYSLYKDIYDRDAYNAEALYNMSQILILYGNYDLAVELLGKASEIDDKTYGPELNAAKAWQEEKKKLEQLGVAPQSVSFSGNNSGSSTNKLTTRGGKGDRYDVHKEANASSEVTTKVPGNTPFDIVEIKGEWILIKLLGGKQGYISKDNVKL
ncbi:MAG: tetratricopeptide repeat protein [Bacteroidia bacterium]|nr:tetratricopeptide repeat protein [Bacteroidia bacterium]